LPLKNYRTIVYETVGIKREAGLPQPKTILTNIPRHAGFLIEKVGGLPTGGKATRGSQGKAVFIMETPLAANTNLQTFLKGKAESIIIQQFIESSANNKAVHDIRAIVVGDRVVSAMERNGQAQTASTQI
jgi:ribosomal protein S6--L-glutamate ligase